MFDYLLLTILLRGATKCYVLTSNILTKKNHFHRINDKIHVNRSKIKLAALQGIFLCIDRKIPCL